MKKNRKVIFSVFLCLVGTILFYIYMYNQNNSMLKIIKFLLLSYILFYLAWMDIKTRKIGNKFILLLIMIRFIFLFIETMLERSFLFYNLYLMFIGCLIGGGILLICRMIVKNSIGMGDIKLFGVLGMYFGYDILYVMFFSFLCSALYSFLMIIRKKKSRKDTIPLAPFVFLGTILELIVV